MHGIARFAPHPAVGPEGASAASVAAATTERSILVIEDERDIADLVALHLAELPARVTLAADGPAGLRLATSRVWDAIVLDIRLPGMNGLDVCRELRAQHSPVPILMLTARGGELDRVLGLELGADDYLTKPFSVLELRARVRALWRRADITAAHSSAAVLARPATLAHGPLRLDRTQRRVWLAGQELTLTPREFDLLGHFMQEPGRVFTRTERLEQVWGYGHDGYDHTVNSHINRLRNKLGDDRGEPHFVHTVWGVGYRFEWRS
jgi:DNA-binding response OmpR family regulator